MRDKPKLNVKDIDSFDGKYLWETALVNVRKTYVTGSEIKTYGSKYEIIFNELKSDFITSCESTFLTIQYVNLPKKPIFDDMVEKNSNRENVEISLANIEKRLAYYDKLSSEISSYQDRVAKKITSCIESIET
jgi:flagellin-like hook-associated protein FlgL